MTERLPPHSGEIEKAVLGSVLMESLCFDEASRRIKTPLAFYEVQNQLIWQTVALMHGANERPDVVSLHQRLSKDRKLTEAGGLNYLWDLQDDAVPGALEQHLDQLLELYKRRRVIEVCTRRVAEAFAGDVPAEMLIEQSHAELDALNDESSGVVSANQASTLLTEDLQRRYELQGQLSGVPTGFWYLDRLTDGLQFGDQTIVASRPSVGKTAFALNVFHHSAFLRGVPSLFVSLEMSVGALMRRLASYATEIKASVLRRGSYQPEDYERLKVFSLKTVRAPIGFLDFVSGVTISRLCAEVRLAVRRHGFKFVIIDYLQRIAPDRREEKRTYEVGAVSTRLCALADQTGAALLTLAQLSRESEKDKQRLPRMSDLADSAQIDRDADTIGLLHRDRKETSGNACLIIVKQRDGETGLVKLDFDGTLVKFSSAAD